MATEVAYSCEAGIKRGSPNILAGAVTRNTPIYGVYTPKKQNVTNQPTDGWTERDGSLTG